MREYVGEPGLTAQAFDSRGWFLTGDIGELDKAGNLTISGRRKDLIIRGGYNIFPAEVEAALLTLPGVSEVGVVGYQDDCLGERICAFVKMREGGREDPAQIRTLLARYLAKYKLPDCIVFVSELPKLANGKCDYPALSGMLKEERRAVEPFRQKVRTPGNHFP